MADENVIEVVLRMKDEGVQQAAAQAKQSVADLGEAGRKSGESIGVLDRSLVRQELSTRRSDLSLREVTRSLRFLGFAVLQEADPAIQRLVFGMDSAARVTNYATGALTKFAVGGLAVGAVAVSAYILRLKEFAEAHAAANLAIQRLDVESALGKLHSLEDQIKVANIEIQKVSSDVGGIASLGYALAKFIPGVGQAIVALEHLSGKTGPEVAQTLLKWGTGLSSLERQLKPAQEAFANLVPFQTRMVLAQAAEDMAKLTQQLLQFQVAAFTNMPGQLQRMFPEIGTERTRRDIEAEPGPGGRPILTIGRQQITSLTALRETLAALSAAENAEVRASIDRAQAEMERALAGIPLTATAEARAEAQENIRRQFASRFQAAQNRLMMLPFQQRQRELEEVGGFIEREVQGTALRPDITAQAAAAATAFGGPEAFPPVLKIIERIRQAVGANRAEIEQQAEKLGLDVGVVLDSGLADGVAKSRFVQSGAEFVRGLLDAGQTARDSVLSLYAKHGEALGLTMGQRLASGFELGLIHLKDSLGTAGENMARVVEGVGQSMVQNLDDTFFSVLTGKFEDLPNIARRAGEAMLRELTGALARLVVNSTISQLLGAFFPLGSAAPGLGGIPLGAGALALPGLGAVALAGAPVAEPGFFGSIRNALGDLLSSLGAGGQSRGTSVGGISSLLQQVGGLGFGQLGGSALSSFSSLLQAAQLAPRLGVSFGEAFSIVQESARLAAALGAEAPAAGFGFSSLFGSLSAVGSILGGGFSLFQAIMGQAGGPLVSSLGGALGGVSIGLGLSSLAGVSGPLFPIVGAAVGFLGGLFGGFKGQKQRETQAQYAQRYRQAFAGVLANGAQTWVSRLAAIRSLDELDAFLTKNPSSLITFGGPTPGLVGIPGTTTYTEWLALYAGQGLGTKPATSRNVFSSSFNADTDVAYLFEGPAWAYPGAGQAVNGMKQALQQKAAELRTMYNAAFESQVTSSIVRQTMTAGTAPELMARQQFFRGQAQFRALLLSAAADPSFSEELLKIFAGVAQNLDLPLLRFSRAEEFLFSRGEEVWLRGLPSVALPSTP